MSDIDLFPEAGSPFDAIRQVRADGTEYWSARDLMPLLGYDKWERFDGAVERAAASLTAQGHDADWEASRLREPSGQTNQMREDYHLSRFASYLVAMNGDPRKPEVAAAQAYFAVRTREAETAQPAELTEDQILHRAMGILDGRVKALTVENKALTAAIERDAPLVAKAEAHTGSDSAIHRQEFAREVIAWGRKQNITIRQEHVMRFLGHIGLFIRGERTDTGHATADAIKRGLAFTEKGIAKNGHAWATGKLTASGQDYAWKRITKHVEANGTLELPRELRAGVTA